MPLPLMGTISSEMINEELGRTLGSELNLRLAASGSYEPINQNSYHIPSPTAPHSYSDWYGYNHQASETDPYPYQHYLYELDGNTCSSNESELQIVFSNFTPLSLNATVSSTTDVYTSFTNNVNYSYYNNGTKYRILIRLISGELRVDEIENCGSGNPPQQ